MESEKKIETRELEVDTACEGDGRVGEDLVLVTSGEQEEAVKDELQEEQPQPGSAFSYSSSEYSEIDNDERPLSPEEADMEQIPTSNEYGQRSTPTSPGADDRGEPNEDDNSNLQLTSTSPLSPRTNERLRCEEGRGYYYVHRPRCPREFTNPDPIHGRDSIVDWQPYEWEPHYAAKKYNREPHKQGGRRKRQPDLGSVHPQSEHLPELPSHLKETQLLADVTTEAPSSASEASEAQQNNVEAQPSIVVSAKSATLSPSEDQDNKGSDDSNETAQRPPRNIGYYFDKANLWDDDDDDDSYGPQALDESPIIDRENASESSSDHQWSDNEEERGADAPKDPSEVLNIDESAATTGSELEASIDQDLSASATPARDDQEPEAALNEGNDNIPDSIDSVKVIETVTGTQVGNGKESLGNFQSEKSLPKKRSLLIWYNEVEARDRIRRGWQPERPLLLPENVDVRTELSRILAHSYREDRESAVAEVKRLQYCLEQVEQSWRQYSNSLIDQHESLQRAKEESDAVGEDLGRKWRAEQECNDKLRGTIKQKLEHIAGWKEHTDKLRGELERLREETDQTTGEANGLREQLERQSAVVERLRAALKKANKKCDDQEQYVYKLEGDLGLHSDDEDATDDEKPCEKDNPDCEKRCEGLQSQLQDAKRLYKDEQEKVRRLTSQIKDANEIYERLLADCQRLRNKKGRNSDQRDDNKLVYPACKERCTALEEQLEQAKQAMQELIHELRVLEDRCQTYMNMYDDEYKALSEDLDQQHATERQKVEQDIRDIEQRCQSLGNDLAGVREAVERLEHIARHILADYATLQNAHDELQREVSRENSAPRCEETCKGLREVLEQLREAYEDLQQRHELCNDEAERIAQAPKLPETNEELENERDQLRDALVEANEALDQLDQRCRDFEAEAETLKTDNTDLHEQLNQQRSNELEREQLHDKLADLHQEVADLRSGRIRAGKPIIWSIERSTRDSLVPLIVTWCNDAHQMEHGQPPPDPLTAQEVDSMLGNGSTTFDHVFAAINEAGLHFREDRFAQRIEEFYRSRLVPSVPAAIMFAARGLDYGLGAIEQLLREVDGQRQELDDAGRNLTVGAPQVPQADLLALAAMNDDSEGLRDELAQSQEMLKHKDQQVDQLKSQMNGNENILEELCNEQQNLLNQIGDLQARLNESNETVDAETQTDSPRTEPAISDELQRKGAGTQTDPPSSEPKTSNSPSPDSQELHPSTTIEHDLRARIAQLEQRSTNQANTITALRNAHDESTHKSAHDQAPPSSAILSHSPIQQHHHYLATTSCDFEARFQRAKQDALEYRRAEPGYIVEHEARREERLARLQNAEAYRRSMAVSQAQRRVEGAVRRGRGDERRRALEGLLGRRFEYRGLEERVAVYKKCVEQRG